MSKEGNFYVRQNLIYKWKCPVKLIIINKIRNVYLKTKFYYK